MFYKQKSIKIGHFRVELLPLIVTVLGVAILCLLGLWQLSRLVEKNDFIKSVSTNLDNPANIYNPNKPASIYQKIKLFGHFLPHKNIYLYGRKAMAPEKEGYYLLTPFQTTEGRIIMIARGWFAAKNKATINTSDNNNIIEISGIILPLEKKRMFIPSNDLKNNVWFTLEHQQMNNYVEYDLENFYILQLDPKNLSPHVIAIDATNLVRIKNDHLEYALTWFCLAVCLIFIFFVYIRQKQVIQI